MAGWRAGRLAGSGGGAQAAEAFKLLRARWVLGRAWGGQRPAAQPRGPARGLRVALDDEAGLLGELDFWRPHGAIVTLPAARCSYLWPGVRWCFVSVPF